MKYSAEYLFFSPIPNPV